MTFDLKFGVGTVVRGEGKAGSTGFSVRTKHFQWPILAHKIWVEKRRDKQPTTIPHILLCINSNLHFSVTNLLVGPGNGERVG